MKIDRARGFLIGVIAAVLVCLIQAVRLILYLTSLHKDWVGIALCAASIVAFAFVAVGFYIQWKRRQDSG